NHLPGGYIPNQDQGRLMAAIQLPDASSLERTQHVVDVVARMAHKTPGCAHTISVAGQSFSLGATGSNFGNMFISLKEFADRRDPNQSAESVARRLDYRLKNLYHLSDQSMAALRQAALPEDVLAKIEEMRQEQMLGGEMDEFIGTKGDFKEA